MCAMQTIDVDEEIAAGLDAAGGSNKAHGSNDLSYVQLFGDEFDWESYIAKYTGRTRIDRLIFIAQRCPQLRKACSDAAIAMIKDSTTDTGLYNEALRLRNTSAQHGEPLLSREERLALDQSWYDTAQRDNHNELEKLDLELRHYQNNLIKESVRMAHRDLGDHLRAMGNLNEALKYYIKTRDHCSTSEHVVEMCINVIEVSLDLKEYHAISAYVSKAEGLLDSYNPLAAASSSGKSATSQRAGSGMPANKGGNTSGGDMIGALFRAGGSAGSAETLTLSSATAMLNAAPSQSTREAEAQGKRQVAEIRSKLNVAQGIAYLGMSSFKAARATLLEVDVARSDAYSNMASRADVALYVVLCSIAMLDRRELKSTVIDRPNIAALLESDTQARDLVEFFYACQYKKTLALLEKMKTRILLDVHLAPHYNILVDNVTRRALRQFVQPFDSLRIERLANSMGWQGEQGVERATNELIALIQTGGIKGKLDLIDKVYLANKKDPRRQLFDDALEMGQQRTESAKHLVLRMSILQANLIVRLPNERAEG